MIQKITLSLLRFFLFFSIFLSAKTNLYAQKLTVKPLDGVDRLCAGPTFNQFFATFNYEDFPSDVTFEVQISDTQGNFDTTFRTAKTLDIIPVSTTQQTIKFAVPDDLIGSETYSFRVKSSTGVVSSKIRNALGDATYPAYYKSYSATFSINKKGISAVICTGGSLTLSVDNDTPNVPGSSPALNSNFKYIWFKDFNVIAGQSSSSLVVNTPGDYYAQIDYGLCSESNISSNIVSITTVSATGSNFNIESSLGNPFCSSGDGTVLTAQTTGNSYQWYKDGTAVKDATTRSYLTNEPGTYMVSVNFGTCDASASIVLKSNGFNASIDVAEENVIDTGTFLKATITSDATNATYEWSLNGTVITGANTNTINADKRGNYSVKISQSAGCVVSKEFKFKVSFTTDPNTSVTKIANIISLSSYPYDVWDIPSEYKNAETRVTILSSNGDKVIDTVNYQGDWPPPGTIDFKNVNPVYYYVIQSDTGEKKGSITVIK